MSNEEERLARIMSEATKIIEAEDAKTAANNQQNIWIEEMARLQKSPSRNWKRLQELEKLLGWDEPTPWLNH